MWVDPSPENAARLWQALAAFGAPLNDLEISVPKHTIRDRTKDAPPYRWKFTEWGSDGRVGGGREIAVSVPGRTLSTDSRVNLGLARAGLGLTIVYEDMVRDDVARRR